MSDSVLVALISGGITLTGILATFFANRSDFQHRSELADQKLEATLEKNIAVMDNRIETLTDEVRRHNGFAQRLPALEQKVTDINERLKQVEQK